MLNRELKVWMNVKTQEGSWRNKMKDLNVEGLLKVDVLRKSDLKDLEVDALKKG